MAPTTSTSTPRPPTSMTPSTASWRSTGRSTDPRVVGHGLLERTERRTAGPPHHCRQPSVRLHARGRLSQRSRVRGDDDVRRSARPEALLPQLRGCLAQRPTTTTTTGDTNTMIKNDILAAVGTTVTLQNNRGRGNRNPKPRPVTILGYDFVLDPERKEHYGNHPREHYVPREQAPRAWRYKRPLVLVEYTDSEGQAAVKLVEPVELHAIDPDEALAKWQADIDERERKLNVKRAQEAEVTRMAQAVIDHFDLGTSAYVAYNFGGGQHFAVYPAGLRTIIDKLGIEVPQEATA